MIKLSEYLKEAKMAGPFGFCDDITMNLQARPHQVVALNNLFSYSRFGLFDDPGTGKTLPLQAKAIYYAQQGIKTLALMPPILLGQYVQTLGETFNQPENYISWHVLQEEPKKREKLFALWDVEGYPDILLMSYEMFALLVKVDKKSERRSHYARKLRDIYRAVDCDEAHALCGATTVKHDALDWFLVDESDSNLILATGTPMPNTPLNAYGLTHFLNPEAYRDYRQFERKHAVYEQIKLREPRKSKSGKEITHAQILKDYKDLQLLRFNLYKNARRVIKEQVLSLKEPQILEIPVVLSESHMKLYKQLERERILEYQGEIIAGGIGEQRLRQALLRIVTNPEAFLSPDVTIQNNIMAKTKDIIFSHNDAKPDENGFPNKVIIFCNLRATAAFLREQLKEYGAVVLNGETSNKEKVRQTFLTDPECRVLVANPESAGVGLNFQHISCTVIFVEPTGVPGEFKQAIERIWRSGQELVCMIYILRAVGTIAPKATRLMLEKAEDINLVNRDQVLFSTYLKRVDTRKRQA